MSDSKMPPAMINPDLLRNIGLFGGVADETLQRLCDNLPQVTAEVGEYIVREGDAARELFVVVGGELEVVKSSKTAGDVRVAMMGPGDWFGEMAVLDVQPRSASVRSVAPSLLLRMDADMVERLIYREDLKSYALFIMNIARELSRRLRVADGILAQMMIDVSDQYARGPGNR